MMRNPPQQAKLIFLYLLRSSAEAFATESSLSAAAATTSNSGGLGLSSSAASYSTVSNVSAALLDGGHLNLRVARKADVPWIQRCNLATLPENYQQHYYINHLRQWPELSLVVEHVPRTASRVSDDDDDNVDENNPTIKSRWRSLADPNGSSENLSPAGPQIIGYVLGKVINNNNINKNLLANGEMSAYASQEKGSSGFFGHVTSLAVMKEYRRLGLAGKMMEQLHHNLQSNYDADTVGLHVRISNTAATNLYKQSMGYDISDIIKSYYHDGEDAYLMTRNLKCWEASGSIETSAVSDSKNYKQQQPKRRSVLGSSIQFFRDGRRKAKISPEVVAIPQPSITTSTSSSATVNILKKDMRLPRVVLSQENLNRQILPRGEDNQNLISSPPSVVENTKGAFIDAAVIGDDQRTGPVEITREDFATGPVLTGS
mmetsp:Transcript_52610/g.61414  ORF Transcript_52610/g.61414 Transcript_52610/m.61414 type:complete len:430 (+) Transcript_52610:139-1428(+)